MNKTIAIALVGLSLVASGCYANIAAKKDDSRVYFNTSMKEVVSVSMQAIKAENLSITSTDSPVSGIVSISALGGRNALIQNEASHLSVTLTEIDPARIRVEVTATQPGQMMDYGITEGMVNDYFKVMDGRLNHTGPAAQH